MAGDLADFRRFLRWTFALSWGVGGLYLLTRFAWPLLPPLDASNPVLHLTFCAPGLAGVAMAWRYGGGRGAAALLGRMLRPFGWIWALVALLILPLLAALAAVLEGSRDPASPFMAMVAPALFLSTAAIGEEIGWRGWALPRLLQDHSAWAASLMLAAAWIVWHLPAFVMGGGVMRATLTDLPWWALATLGLTLLMTALHLRANGNLLVAGVLPHAVINALGATDQWTSRPIQALLLLASGAFLLRGAAPARKPRA